MKETEKRKVKLSSNKEQIFDLIQGHPDGLDDDDLSDLSGIRPRQQVQQLCNQLVAADRIRRESVSKIGKRRKIHNFPIEADPSLPENAPSWKRRLANLCAVTGESEDDILDAALQALAVKILAEQMEADMQDMGA